MKTLYKSSEYEVLQGLPDSHSLIYSSHLMLLWFLCDSDDLTYTSYIYKNANCCCSLVSELCSLEQVQQLLCADVM